MVRILHAPRWALAVVLGTFVVAVAILVTGLSASANASPSNAAPPQRAATAGDYHTSGGQDGKDGHDGNKDDHETKTKTSTSSKPPTTVTTTKTKTETETATTTTTAPTETLTKLPVTGDSSRSPLVLIGSGLLVAAGLGMFGLRRWRRVADGD
jgi:LPXTG-motif cell wall-anchored protein